MASVTRRGHLLPGDTTRLRVLISSVMPEQEGEESEQKQSRSRSSLLRKSLWTLTELLKE